MSTETNTFGTNEFIDWCRAADIEPMLAVNLGTRGGDAARNMVEYCNHPGGTTLSDLRRKHGWDKPHDVKFWCLGNEMDGPWQMEAKTADRVRPHRPRSRQDDAVDRSRRSSSPPAARRAARMPTFGAWEDTVLEHTFDQVEYISLHTYLNNYDQRHAGLPGERRPDGQLHRRGGGDRRCGGGAPALAKRIMLSFDEWNVWYRTRRNRAARVKEGWPVAPPILEEIYNMEDALAFGGCCISLLNHADRVKAACLAQLVNVIAPIMTETGGPAWRQTIFYPFAHFSRMGRGRVLRTEVELADLFGALQRPAADRSTTTTTSRRRPTSSSSAVHDDEAGRSPCSR